MSHLKGHQHALLRYFTAHHWEKKEVLGLEGKTWLQNGLSPRSPLTPHLQVTSACLLQKVPSTGDQKTGQTFVLYLKVPKPWEQPK